MLILCIGLHEVVKEHWEIAGEHLQVQKDLAKEREAQECHQMFRLTTDSRDATYEWYKDRVEERVQDTCLWFLKHEHFQDWLKQESGPLLVTADPGCGKSVLAKYLVDHYLPRSITICYFFFKDKDQNTIRQALCALLHQLFSQKQCLIKHAMLQFCKDGQGLINSIQSLWEVLQNATKDPQVLDALDECAETDCTDLIRHVRRQCLSDESSQSRLKYLLTSRPYEQIVSEFHDVLSSFPNIRIPGEDESEAISQEINLVIAHRVHQLSEKKTLSNEIKTHLNKRLQETTHRTYLWVYLVFDYLESKNFKRTLKGIMSIIAALPENVNHAYEQILNKSEEHPMVRKALSIILAASRPLTVSEMNIAVNSEATIQSMCGLDLENETNFKSRLRYLCGLFIAIHHGKVYFLHQTAREFLLTNSASLTTTSPELRWHHSITTNYAHIILARACVAYLNCFNSNGSILKVANGGAGNPIDYHAFLDYSAKNWATHFREAGIAHDDPIVLFVLKICDMDLGSYSAWFVTYWKTTGLKTTRNFTNLMLSSYFGHDNVVKLLVENGADVEAKDSEYGRTALSWAAENGHTAISKLLVDNNADLETKDVRYGRTALSWAAGKGCEAVVKLLIEKGAKVDAKSNHGWTALWCAAKKGCKSVVKLLIENGADVESKDSLSGRTPLSWAAEHGHLAIVKLLVESGAKIESKSNSGWTALSWAAEKGYNTIVRLLVDEGADVEAKSTLGWTPLLWAAENGHIAVVKILIEKGANVEATSNCGWTALRCAATKGHMLTIELLIENGADIEVNDDYGRTTLLWAAENGYAAVVKLLVNKGAKVDVEDNYGQTPLLWVTRDGEEAAVRMLIENGARY